MEYLQLQVPTFLAAGNRQFDSSLRGIRQAGPFDRGTCPATPRLLFVFPDELKDLANRLFLVLRNGVGPFSGTEAWFGMSLNKESVFRPDSFSVAGLSPFEVAQRYSASIEGFLGKGIPIDGALVIHSKSDRFDVDNPYLHSKFLLLKNNVPTQIVTTDVLDDERTLQWSVANVALALFAKLGGRPWAVRSCATEDTLVVGINRAIVRSNKAKSQQRFFGFATAFSHHGLYLGIRIFPAADELGAYLKGLRNSIAAALDAWHKALGRPVNLVMHLPKEPNKSEKAALEGAINDVGPASVHSSSIIRLSEAPHIQITDPNSENSLPRPGVLLRLDRDRAVLQLTGRKEDVVGGATEASPWTVRIISQMGTSPPLRDLCDHVFALSYMNWRGINAIATPVSIEYPRLIADLMARFAEAEFDVSKITGQQILERPWFL